MTTWLIESNVYGDEITPLVAEIKRQGLPIAVIPYRSLTKGSVPLVDGQPVAADACVIGYGTFPFARQIQLHHTWRPGAWCNPQTLDCATYFAYFGQYLLNQNYIIMPGVEAIRQADWLFSTLAENEELFVRPTSCHKLFVGRRVSRDDFSRILAPTRYDPATVIVIARPRDIGREWRLIVIGDQIISGSQYAENCLRCIKSELPDNVTAFASEMLQKISWRPDPIFMLDICESEGGLHLVELNSFSASWLYACDFAAVVKSASLLAESVANHSYPVAR